MDGEKVVREGQSQLRPGAKLAVREAPGGAGKPGGDASGAGAGRSARHRQASRGQKGAAVNVSELFIRRPVGTALLMIGVAVAGVAAYQQLPVSALPQVDYPTIVVSTILPGRQRRHDGLGGDDAARAAARADPVAGAPHLRLQRRQLADHAAVHASTATSTPPSRTCRRRSTRRRTCCPRRCPRRRPTARATRPTCRSSRWRSAPTPPPLSVVDDYADSILAQKLSQVSGVGLVTLNGGQRPAVRVQVDPVALAGRGLGLEDVRVGAGAGQRQPAEGEPGRPAPELPGVGQRPAALGRGLQAAGARLPERRAWCASRDVAKVLDGVENAQLAGWANEHPAVILNVQRQPGANLIEVAERVKALLPRLRGVAAAGDQGRHPLRPHRDGARLGPTTSSSRCS